MNMFIKIVCSLTFLFLITTDLRADHIVGGHIEMQAIGKTPGKYAIILKLYFNALNPSYDVPNTVEKVGISQKSNHKSITVLSLPMSKQTLFEYSNEDCAKLNKLKIIEVTYEAEWEVNPENFQDADGYYIYQDRCCRNAGITNIVNSYQASMAFYTEFPPMKRNGKFFLNSTPSFDVLSGEYVCINDPFKYNFKAKDADGDSLHYQLATPLLGKSSIFETERLLSGPFAGVTWQNGYGLSNTIPGAPNLSIDAKKGFITVTPNQLGLFVFSVICTEYRKIGKVYVKLGITQRDFQLKIIDCPVPTNLPDPVISVLERPGTEPSICFGDKVTFQATTNPNWNYQWELDGDNIPDANYDKLVASKPGVYNLTVSIKNQCTKSRTSRQITLKLLTEKVKLKANEKTFCEGGNVILEAPLEGSNFSYTWLQDEQIISNVEQKIEVNKSGKYFVAIADNTKPTDCPAVSDTIFVEEFMNPEAELNSDRASNLICEGETLLLKANEGEDLQYDWQLNGTHLTITTIPEYKAGVTGNYTVIVTDINNCKKESEKLKIESVQKEEIKMDSIPSICELNKGVILLKGYPAGGIFKGLGIIDQNQGAFNPDLAGLGKHTINYEYKGLLQCQSGSAQRDIIIAESFKLNLNPKEFNIWKGASVSLVAPNSKDFKYQWLPENTLSNGKIASPIARPNETVTYTLVLIDDNGCVSQDTVKVNVTQKIWIPNVFSPNGDSQNDNWILPGTESYQDVEVSIYNRWGEMVFYSKGYSTPFDGTFKNDLLPVDTYIYRIVVPSKGFLFNGSLLITR